MSDLSNKTILLLILVSIVISVVGIFSAPKGIVYITGLASSGQGSVAFNITSEASILIARSIAFGLGRVNSNSSSAILDSNQGAYNITFTDIITASPPIRGETPLVYDMMRDRFVIFGGFDAASLNDTWEFNPVTETWSEIAVTAAPQRRFRHGMVYDSKRNVTVLFGGSVTGLSGFYNTTWEYDGTTWTNITTANRPSARQPGFGMAYDSARNVTVLFGGYGGSVKNDTWEYNGTNWNQINTSTVPGPRWLPTMTFDSTNGKIILFGGTPDGSTLLNEVWEYNGTNWANVTPLTGGEPIGRIYGAFTYDDRRNLSVLFGGQTGLFYLNDSWLWKDNIWYHNLDAEDQFFGQNLTVGGTPVTGVSPGGAHYMTANTSLNRCVYFIGATDAGNTNITLYRDATINPTSVINGSWFFMKQFFHVENDGTVNISVNFTSDKNATEFIGGTGASFQIKAADEPSHIGSCPGMVTTYTEALNSTQNICPHLDFGNMLDEFRVPVRLVIPSDAGPGEKTATLTFTAQQI